MYFSDQTFLIVASVVFVLLVLLVIFLASYVAKLKKRDVELEEFQKAQDEYLPMLVHELRAPLSVIKGGSDLLLKDVQNLSADQIHTLLSQIRTSSTSLLSMVSDILDVSKMKSGKFEINKTFSNIADVLEEQCSYFSSLASVKGLKIELKVDKSTPHFSFDPERIKQVLSNLLSNSIKFTSENGIINVVEEKIDGYVQIYVSDTGVGISDEEKKRLFSRFYQAKNNGSVKEKGTGLGLVIAKGIVEAHGGKIWVENNNPRGSKFIFTLPLG